MTATVPLFQWWWRLQWLQWLQSAQEQPRRRSLGLLAWWTPCVLAPVALSIAGSSAAETGLSFLLSLDVPLTLVVAAATTLSILAIQSQARSTEWLWPLAFQPAGLKWISRLRWLTAARWPAGLALATALLAQRTSIEPDAVTELMVMALLGAGAGGIFAWTMRNRFSAARQSAPIPRGRGMAALSWVAFNETRTRFDLRRIMLLAVPALLAVPMGAMAGDAAGMLVIWLPLLFIVTLCREAAQVQGVLRKWLRATPRLQLQLAWRVWRYIVLGIVVLIGLYLLR